MELVGNILRDILERGAGQLDSGVHVDAVVAFDDEAG